MNKTYIQLKELPFLPIGTVWEFNVCAYEPVVDISVRFSESEIIELTKQGWFKEKEPERWRAKYKTEIYWFVDTDGEVDFLVDLDEPIDGCRYEIGNYYRTKKQAQHAATLVKQAFMKAHEEEK